MAAKNSDRFEVHVEELMKELDESTIKVDALLHVYDARVQRYLADNDRVWTTGALLMPLALAGVAILAGIKSPSIPQRAVIGVGSVLLMVSWNLFADHHRGFQTRSEAWITAIENHLGLTTKGSNKAGMPRFYRGPLQKVRWIRWLLALLTLAYWILAFFAFD